ncbi:MAG: glycosyltransferase family 4 protein [Acidobacteriota bacterium]
MIKIGVVVQRYGIDVLGGAETLARSIAERLNSSGFDLTVFTTTAKDYITWKPHYKEGGSILKGVEIRRFDVEQTRDIESFNRYSESFFQKDQKEKSEEVQWIDKQGPLAPGLLKDMEKEQDNYDLFIFFTYLYYTTVKGMELIKKPVIMFPTAHDELPIHLDIMNKVFKRPDSFFFLTDAEMNFIKNKFNPPGRMNLLRTGVDIMENTDETLFRKKFRIVAPFIMYAGRIEKGKGLEVVFEAFREIRKKSVVDLVLMGKKLMDIPDEDGIKYVGFVSEEEKLSAFKAALFSIQPSPLESLSITTLESFSQKTPVLVNKKCNVLMEHVKLSDGGYSYENKEQFIDNFYKLSRETGKSKIKGQKGFQYVKKYFSWEIVIGKIKNEINFLMK